jgi:hypothetical protein
MAGTVRPWKGDERHASWADWFEGMALTQENDGTTSLCGRVVDQAALHGLLAKVRDIGATLIAVNLLEDQDPGQNHQNLALGMQRPHLRFHPTTLQQKAARNLPLTRTPHPRV